MKKLLLFLIILFTALSFVSCNDDDDDNARDKILGKWKLDQEFLNNVETTLDACDKMTTIEFFANGTYSEKDFEYNESQTTCLPLEDINGMWEYIGNSTYEISDTSSIPGVDLAMEFKITFGTNKMTIEFSETFEGQTFIMKGIFIKVTA